MADLRSEITMTKLKEKLKPTAQINPITVKNSVKTIRKAPDVY